MRFEGAVNRRSYLYVLIIFLKWKSNLIIAENGVSNLTQHLLLKVLFLSIRRIHKIHNTLVVYVSEVKITNRPETFNHRSKKKDYDICIYKIL
jgi:hypothetical protein